MRLLTRTTLYFLLVMIPLLCAGGYLIFRQFSLQINERADKELVYEEVQWINYLESATANGGNFILRSPDLLIYPTRETPTAYAEIITTQGNKAREGKRVPYRQLSHVVEINGVPYRIVIRRSQEQKQALVANITTVLGIVFAALFLGTLLINWLISKRLWRPFRSSLQLVRNLELQKTEALQFEETGIEEFRELNASLNTMVEKIRSDYRNMKEFTENAAHEMQTPLAVAGSKLELLLQDSSLNDAQAGTIAQASMALSRLSKLNQSLLLLAKIENNQFEATEPVNLTEVTRKYLSLFDEMVRDKNLEVVTKGEHEFPVLLHPFLADSLVSNLLGNAIKYNEEGGKIVIHIKVDAYCIRNTSPLPPIEAAHLFRRFKSSGSLSGNGTGLGLALVKRIADAGRLSITYRHDEGMHAFCIRKPDI